MMTQSEFGCRGDPDAYDSEYDDLADQQPLPKRPDSPRASGLA
jgi:hypothetical protein